MMKRGIDTPSSEEALIVAVRKNQLECVEHQLSRKAPRRMSYLLYIATHYGSLDCLRYLLNYELPHFNMNSSYGGRKTLAHVAMRLPKPEVLEMLWSRGASLDLRDRKGNTPLHLACHRNFPDVVLALLRLGADVNAENHKGMNPVEFISDINCETGRILREHIAALQAAGLYVSAKCQSFIGNEQSAVPYNDQIKIMKDTLIPGTTICFYRLLVCSLDEIAIYVNSPLIMEAIESEEWKEALPNYIHLLSSKLKLGLRRRRFIDDFKRNVLPTLRCANQLPWVCIEKILSFISIGDLGIMAGHYRSK